MHGRVPNWQVQLEEELKQCPFTPRLTSWDRRTHVMCEKRTHEHKQRTKGNGRDLLDRLLIERGDLQISVCGVRSRGHLDLTFLQIWAMF